MRLDAFAGIQAFAGMLDDAAVFPPGPAGQGGAPLDAALPAHRALAGAWYRELAGPFVFPAGRLDELAAALDGKALNGGPQPVALAITATGADGLRAALGAAGLPGARLAAIELVPDAALALQPGGDDNSKKSGGLPSGGLPDLPEGVRVYIEVPRGPGGLTVLDALAGTALRAKFRTGGLVPQAHPDEAELAASIAAAVSRGVPFKCTAGLHHAVRHTDASGQHSLEQHGFLNVLLATHAALDGGTEQDLAALLAMRDADQVADRIRALGEAGLSRAREWFVSFGTCSIDDPVTDLVALGLITAPG